MTSTKETPESTVEITKSLLDQIKEVCVKSGFYTKKVDELITTTFFYNAEKDLKYDTLLEAFNQEKGNLTGFELITTTTTAKAELLPLIVGKDKIITPADYVTVKSFSDLVNKLVTDPNKDFNDESKKLMLDKSKAKTVEAKKLIEDKLTKLYKDNGKEYKPRKPAVTTPEAAKPVEAQTEIEDTNVE